MLEKYGTDDTQATSNKTGHKIVLSGGFGQLPGSLDIQRSVSHKTLATGAQ